MSDLTTQLRTARAPTRRKTDDYNSGSARVGRAGAPALLAGGARRKLAYEECACVSLKARECL